MNSFQDTTSTGRDDLNLNTRNSQKLCNSAKLNNRELAALLPKQTNRSPPAVRASDDVNSEKCASCDVARTKCLNCCENTANLRQLSGLEHKRSNRDVTCKQNSDVADAGSIPVKPSSLQQQHRSNPPHRLSQGINFADCFPMADDQASTGDVLDNISVGASLDDFLS